MSAPRDGKSFSIFLLFVGPSNIERLPPSPAVSLTPSLVTPFAPAVTVSENGDSKVTRSVSKTDVEHISDREGISASRLFLCLLCIFVL